MVQPTWTRSSWSVKGGSLQRGPFTYGERRGMVDVIVDRNVDGPFQGSHQVAAGVGLWS